MIRAHETEGEECCIGREGWKKTRVRWVASCIKTYGDPATGGNLNKGSNKRENRPAHIDYFVSKEYIHMVTNKVHLSRNLQIFRRNISVHLNAHNPSNGSLSKKELQISTMPSRDQGGAGPGTPPAEIRG